MTTQTLTVTEDQLVVLELALANAGFGATDRSNYRVIVEEIIEGMDEKIAAEFCAVLTSIAIGNLNAEQSSALIEHANEYFIATAGMMQTNSKKLHSQISEKLIGNTAFLILFMNAASLKLGLVR